MQPERFANGTANSIAFHPGTRHLDRHCKPKARPCSLVAAHRDAEQGIPEASAARLDGDEVKLAADATLRRQSVTRVIGRARNQGQRLRNELSAALGTAPAQHEATAFGRHARAKSVRAVAAHLAGLISAFHDHGP
jgi:hypothetical protein